MGASSQDRVPQAHCLTYAPKKLVLEILLAAFLKKRIARLVTSEKRLQVLKIFKGNTDVYFFFFSVVLTVNKSFSVSDLVFEVNFVQRLRGKEE